MLESHIARWMNSGGYRFDRTTDPDGTMRFTLRFSALPPEWSLLIGEAVHGLRASLDHLVYGLAALEQGRPLTLDEARKTEFPIYGADPFTPGLQERKVGLLNEGSQRIIRALQPHGSLDYRKTKLWVLSLLDNRNKHRMIEPSLMAYSAIMPRFAWTGEVTMVTPGSPLHDGLEVFSGKPADQNQRLDVLASMIVVFPWNDPETQGVIDGIGVLTVLRDLHEHVRMIHRELLVDAGYGSPFLTASNVPAEAYEQDEELERQRQAFTADDR